MNYLENKSAEINSTFDNKIELIETNNYLNVWQIENLLPKGKKAKDYTKEQLLKRIEKIRSKEILNTTNEVNSILNADTFEFLKLNIEWKKSSLYGLNPHATLEVYTNKGIKEYKATATGCGYCKESAVIASVLNQSLELRKLLLTAHEKGLKTYGMRSTYFSSGGVGLSSLQNAFELLGHKLNKIASGKLYDCFNTTKIN
jgi:hypothetical protein